MNNLSETIDLLLEDDTPNWDVYSSAVDLYNQLEDAKFQVQNLLHKMHRARQKMCLDLSYRLRKRNPSFNISIDRNGCRIGYRKKSLTFRPDLSKGIWQVISKDDHFANLFKKLNKSALLISHDINNFVEIIFSFFRDQYKTLQEEATIGVIINEGQQISLSELSNLVKTCISD